MADVLTRRELLGTGARWAGAGALIGLASPTLTYGLDAPHASDFRTWDPNFTSRTYTVTLKESDYPADIKRWYRELKYWEFPFPLPSPYFEHCFYVENLADWKLRTDTVGNRWLKLTPADLEAPVKIHVYEVNRQANVDLDVMSWHGYTVPERFQPYLHKTQNCDPTLPGAQVMAAKVKAGTPGKTVRNLWDWLNTVKFGDSGFPNGDLRRPVSEDTLTTNKGVCLHQATAAVAVLRAVGLAARPVRTKGHSFSEVWLPRVGWHAIQQYVAVQRAGWISGYLAEPVDDTSQSPMLRWNMSNHWYTAQFLDFYLTFRVSGEVQLGTGPTYVPMETLAAASRPSGAVYVMPRGTEPNDGFGSVASSGKARGLECVLVSLDESLTGWQLVRGSRPVIQTDREGGLYLTTWRSGLGGAAVCQVLSPAFQLDCDTVGLSMAGSQEKDEKGELESYVGLVVDGQTVLKAGGQGDTILRSVEWDVSKWRGKQARLTVVDNTRLGPTACVLLGEKVTGR